MGHKTEHLPYYPVAASTGMVVKNSRYSAHNHLSLESARSTEICCAEHGSCSFKQKAFQFFSACRQHQATLLNQQALQVVKPRIKTMKTNKI
ncbi:MAG: hypothetical protein JW920_00555 [Deltaproteobacteria bacterium]|nr:hypothetical protein [Deltaproteobacteria bacterium]